MASASLTRRFSELEVDAVPDAPRDVIPEDEKKGDGDAAAGDGSPSVVTLHSSDRVSITEVPEEPATEPVRNRKSSANASSGQKIDLGRHIPHVQLPFSIPPVGPGKSNIVLVNQSNGVQVGDTFVYNTTNVTSPHTTAGVKLKKLDAEEKCLEDLRSVSERVTTEEISAISTHIGVNWKVLGRRLKYTDGQLDQFYLNFEKLHMKEVVYQMLLDWKRTKTSKATVKSLAKHLYKSSEVDAVIELHKLRFGDS